MPIRRLPSLGHSIMAALFLLTTGCSTVQYKALEKVGVDKRDILVDRIKDAQSAQAETKDQMVNAYDELKALTSTDNEALEAQYNKLAKTVEKSEQRAADLDKRIDSVERVGDDLFDEWAEELTQYTNASLRDASEKNMLTTKSRYQQMLTQMRGTQSKVSPVLQVLQDNTLFLKHNLNASAIAGLDTEVDRIGEQVTQLIREMERSIDTAQRYIDGG